MSASQALQNSHLWLANGNLVIEFLCGLLIPYYLWKIVEDLDVLRRIRAAEQRVFRIENYVPHVMVVPAPPMLEHEMLPPDAIAPELQVEHGSSAANRIYAIAMLTSMLHADSSDPDFIGLRKTADDSPAATDHPLVPEFSASYSRSVVDRMYFGDDQEYDGETAQHNDLQAMTGADDTERSSEPATIRYSHVVFDSRFRANSDHLSAGQA